MVFLFCGCWAPRMLFLTPLKKENSRKALMNSCRTSHKNSVRNITVISFKIIIVYNYLFTGDMSSGFVVICYIINISYLLPRRPDWIFNKLVI